MNVPITARLKRRGASSSVPLMAFELLVPPQHGQLIVRAIVKSQHRQKQ